MRTNWKKEKMGRNENHAVITTVSIPCLAYTNANAHTHTHVGHTPAGFPPAILQNMASKASQYTAAWMDHNILPSSIAEQMIPISHFINNSATDIFTHPSLTYDYFLWIDSQTHSWHIIPPVCWEHWSHSTECQLFKNLCQFGPKESIFVWSKGVYHFFLFIWKRCLSLSSLWSETLSMFLWPIVLLLCDVPRLSSVLIFPVGADWAPRVTPGAAGQSWGHY